MSRLMEALSALCVAVGGTLALRGAVGMSWNLLAMLRDSEERAANDALGRAGVDSGSEAPDAYALRWSNVWRDAALLGLGFALLGLSWACR